MTRCPHCQKLCNPLSFMFYHRNSTYKCPICRGNSRLSKNKLSIICAIGGGIGGGFGSRVMNGYGSYGFIVFVFSLSLLIVLSISLFLTLENIDAEMLEEQASSKTD